MGPNLGAVEHVRGISSAQLFPSVSRTLTIEDGDVVITLEVGGIWRSGPGLTAPTTQTLSEYRVSVLGQQDGERIFGMYDPAVASADALAFDRRVRLFYADKDAITLLKDYRTSARL